MSAVNQTPLAETRAWSDMDGTIVIVFGTGSPSTGTRQTAFFWIGRDDFVRDVKRRPSAFDEQHAPAMPAATASKAKRKSTGAAPPAKKARKAVKVADSESDAGTSGGEQDAALSDSDEDVKPKKKKAVKATPKKSVNKSNGTKAKSKAVKGKAQGKGRKSTKDSSGSDQDDESEYAASAVSDDEDDHDFDSDESDGGVKTRVVRDVQKKMPAPKENGQFDALAPC